MLPAKQLDPQAMKKKVLVVDDDAQILRLLKSFLDQRGYDTYTAPNGSDCMAMVGKIDPDLIVLDIRMPQMDGITILNMLKNGGLRRQVPIILLTAMKEQETVVTAGELRADEYVVKPFDLDDLERRVASHLFTIGTDTIREELQLLEKPDNNFFKGAQPGDPTWTKWRIFPVSKPTADLCFLVHPKLDLKSPSQHSDSNLSTHVVVLVKLTSTWKRIYPIT